MNNPAKWISKRLGAKLLVTSALAFAFAWIGHHFVTEVASEWFFYDTRFDSYWEGKCDCAIQSFQEYVSGNNLSRREALTDSEWEREHPDIVLFTEPALLHEEAQADYESGGVEQYEPITCSDGEIYVTSYAPGNIYFYQWKAAGIAIGFMLFLMIIIPFTVHIIHRINKLYHLVLLSGQSGRGGCIAIKGCDEISCLGNEIESMRLSLLALVENEAKIREDSEQLVASLSHDIRTPLTKLTGYLEILIHKKDQPGVDEMVYLEKAAEKARQLKALTDELFEKFVLDGGSDGYRTGTLADVDFLVAAVGHRLVNIFAVMRRDVDVFRVELAQLVDDVIHFLDAVPFQRWENFKRKRGAFAILNQVNYFHIRMLFG